MCILAHIYIEYMYVYIFYSCVRPDDGPLGRNMLLQINNCVLTRFNVISILQRLCTSTLWAFVGSSKVNVTFTIMTNQTIN
jgi:hypothetical protein